MSMDWVRADMDLEDPQSQGYSEGLRDQGPPRQHELKSRVTKCGDRSLCFWGTCTCGQWQHGPHFMLQTVEAYWHDHVHLTCDTECAIHGTRS